MRFSINLASLLKKKLLIPNNLDASIKETIIGSNKLVFQANIKEFKDKSFRLTFVVGVNNDLGYLQISKRKGSLTINIKENNIPEKVFVKYPETF